VVDLTHTVASGRDPRPHRAGAVPAIAALTAALIGLTGCTPPEDDQNDMMADAYEYVDSLRGVNDLAHSSLELPAAATLAGVAAVSMSQRYVGAEPELIDDVELRRLADRSPEDTPAVFSQLCEISSGDAQKARDALSVDDEAVVDALSAKDLPSIDDEDAAVLAADVLSALACRDGVHTAAVPQDIRDRLQQSVESLPLPFTSLQHQGLLSDTSSPMVAPEDIEQLEAEIAAEGCTQWRQAWATAASRATTLPDTILHCAENTTTTLDDPTVLYYFVSARMPRDVLSALLQRNAAAVSDWTRVDATFNTGSDEPTGLGTVAATRDAVALLKLEGIETPPAWIREGLAAASRGDALAWADASSASDFLYLCVSLPGACPASMLDEVRTTVTAGIEGMSTSAPGDDLSTARILEAAAVAELELPGCTPEMADDWAENAPMSLAMLAMSQKECWETLSLSKQDFIDAASSAMQTMQYQSAAGYMILHALGTDGSGDSEMRDAVSASLDDLIASIDESEGAGYVSKARPLPLELLNARIENWTE